MKPFVIPAQVSQVTLKPKKRVPGGTPATIRQAKSKQALQASGGRRVSVNLSRQAVSDLADIKARHGTDNTGAVALALRRISAIR